MSANYPKAGDPANEVTPSLEMARFEFDKALENRKLELEERKFAQARTDMWLRFVTAILLGGIVTVGFNYYAARRAEDKKEAEDKRAEELRIAEADRAARARQAQVAIELVNAREKSSTELRAGMFNALLQNYFHEASQRDRIAILELILLNFRDAVQIRPMLELLDAQIRESASAVERKKLQKELRRAAAVIIKDQLAQIRAAKDGEVVPMRIEVGSTIVVPCGPGGVTLDVEKISRDRSSVTLQPTGAAAEQPGKEIDLSYFDMPMLDYKTVRTAKNVWQYSIVLERIADDGRSADVAVACLPVSHVGPERRYAFDELLDEYLYPQLNPQ